MNIIKIPTELTERGAGTIHEVLLITRFIFRNIKTSQLKAKKMPPTETQKLLREAPSPEINRFKYILIRNHTFREGRPNLEIWRIR